MNRLSKRRKLVIGGCVFAAIVAGLAITGAPAQAAAVGVSFVGYSDQSLTGSSDMTWTVSNGDLSKVPPPGTGQEVLSGGYQDSFVLTGPSQYESSQVLNNSDIVHFDTMSQVQSSGPGLYDESMMLNSAGAPAAGVTCGAGSLDAEGANFTATPYYETVITESMFMTDELAYRSIGSIGQADPEIPDMVTFTAVGSGSGMGSMSFGSSSLAGIGDTSELGYGNSIGKDLMVNGRFTIGEDVRWTSFAKTFDVQVQG
ncbi:MAG: hypothetical protein WCP36_09165 [Methanomicrobiales archaeon]